MGKRVSLREVPALTRNRQEFDANGTLQGVAGPYYSTGRMPDEWRRRYFQDDYNRIVYTVVSYNTPIAWVLDDGTVVEPPVKYSVTTSKHQGKVHL